MLQPPFPEDAMRHLALAALLATLPLAAFAQTGPAELPPADFAGRQYVDSSGCVFVRAEVNGAVTWAPRLNRDRTPLCGYRPSLAAGFGQTAGNLPEIRPDAPPVIVDSATVVETAATTAPAAAPVAAAAPAAVARPGVPRRTDVYAGKYEPSASPGTLSRSQIPRGYKLVWEDGRLNPNRGPRTAAGDASMAQLWSNDVPMKRVTP
jgi:predicted small lipoprotein YifL